MHEVTDPLHKEYTVQAKVTVEPSIDVGYIYLVPPEQVPGKIARTIPVIDEITKSWLLNLDVNEKGQILGIELMRGSLAPPQEKSDCSH